MGRSQNLSNSQLKQPPHRPASFCLLLRTSVRSQLISHCKVQPSHRRALADVALSRLANRLVTSFVYSHDVVSRLCLGAVRDLRNAALWLCDAESNGKAGEGWTTVTSRARQWKAGTGSKDDPHWVCLSSFASSIAGTDWFSFNSEYSLLRSARPLKPICRHPRCSHQDAYCGGCGIANYIRRIGRIFLPRALVVPGAQTNSGCSRC